MKKILGFLVLFISLESFGQYPGAGQTLSNDSTLVTARGAFRSRIINKVFDDTTQANTQRIKFYDGAQVYTKSGGGQLWVRDSTLNKWLPISSTRDRFGFSGEDVQSTGARVFHGNNQSFTMWGMGLETKIHTYPTSLGTRTVGISNSNGTDSAFVLVQGTTTGGQLRTVRAGVNSTDSSKTVELLMRVTSGLPTASLTIKNVRNISGSVALDSNKAYLYRQDLNAVGQPYLTNVYCLDDTLGFYSVNVISAYSKAAYQSATDSLFWGLTNRDASLTFNADGWHAWQTAGEYYFYNVARETDSTGLDFLVYDRADQEMKRFPSDLFWGAGGGGTPGGSNTQLQYNNSGAFGGISGATSNGTIVSLTTPDIVGSNPSISFGAATRLQDFGSTFRLSGPGGLVDLFSSGSSGLFKVYSPSALSSINVQGTATDLVELYSLGTNNLAIQNGSGLLTGIGTATPSEKLDVAGNIRFSGALMPNNVAGTAGNALFSAGAGAPPTWGTVTIPINSLLAATGTSALNHGDFTQVWDWNTLTNTIGLDLRSSSTASSGDNNTVLRAFQSGANASSSQTTYAFKALNSKTGTSSINISGYFSSSGGTNNYAIIVPSGGGDVGIGTPTPTSMLHVNGSFATAYRAITALRTLDITDHTIEVTANTFTVTLPTAVGITGRQYVITNSGAGTTTIATTSSQTFINVTATPTTLTVNQFGTVTVVSNGSNWLRTSSL